MTDRTKITSKNELLTEMDRAWSELKRTVEAADPTSMVTLTDPAGWSAKDHVAHLATWQHGVLVMIRDGRSQWEGMGIDQALYESEGYDEENEVIRQQTADWSLARVMSRIADVHSETTRLVKTLTDDDLRRPCSDVIEDGQDVPIIDKLDGDGPYHYDEHRAYIKRILARPT